MATFTLHTATGLWKVERPHALETLLDHRPDWRRWDVARYDQRQRQELFRFYHKPPASPWLASSGLAVDRGRDGIGWLRFLGEDPERARRTLLALAEDLGALANPADGGVSEPDARAVEQLNLFEVLP